ncbi:MAG: bifunctional glutamate N-acetyltransferase/amino-acid acetyltransferase ArgJ [Gammaproteobacteria bacterium]|nr:bifunctional glutamate N-acetyltransferase/amino-acid acetyltransferase ArgJ [Gammaproteobacteria bacterium]
MDTSVALPIAGVRLATAAAGIRKPGRQDLLLIEIAEGSSTAAMFTSNAFCAAPVILSKHHLAKSSPRFLLINSGNANAGTGEQGMQAAAQSCAAVAELFHCKPEDVLPFSTGVIGEPLPVDKIRAGITLLQSQLREDTWQTAAQAIMTTDTKPKIVSRQITLNGKPITLTGIAKGAGMIRPNMATMLSFLATDAGVDQAVLQSCLRNAVNKSFNRITIDGDTSTNDAVVLMATGRSGVTLQAGDLAAFQSMLDDVCVTLARAIVKDGEGATKLINVSVEQGVSDQECAKVAYAIAHSPLVKTAFFASDPNWGRILAAVGYAGIENLDINKIQIYLDDVCIVRDGGRAASYTEEQGRRVMQQPEITVRVILARGQVNTIVWTCDFSYDYVKINAEYRT